MGDLGCIIPCLCVKTALTIFVRSQTVPKGSKLRRQSCLAFKEGGEGKKDLFEALIPRKSVIPRISSDKHLNPPFFGFLRKGKGSKSDDNKTR